MPATVSDLIVGGFGLISVISGFFGLIYPEMILEIMHLTVVDRSVRQSADYTITFLICLSIASFNIGLYYLIAVWYRWKKFYKLTVMFRFLTFFVLALTIANNSLPKCLIAVAV
ncbi:unnamed protein product [Rotaria sordida]|uniref:Uncharacterized protein n=1 Tax=Rotaria sordida TaxID=392033 RepID=A0A819TME1_9BILA|nr:unnamed protein product [Rotaria sordida]CAF1414685.1 unnamed protein product [Rotaria sordida]CAF1457422.1 unnamed protein product [Rotaria sordida]CAF1480274.1 unnamed protein product [Rotaria sordida]CAF1605188.1 unnamed protein product [Rotaria sordida]